MRAGVARLFVSPAMHLLEGDEQCAQPQLRRPIASIFTEQPSSEAVFLQTPLATHCALSHYTPQTHCLARCEVTDFLTRAAWTIPAVRPRSKSEPRDTHALGHAPLQRQTRPLVGGVSFPPQFMPILLAVLMSSQPPAAAMAEAAAEAAESVEAAAGAMETAAVVTAEAPAAAELEEVEAEAEADAAQAVTAVAAAATTEPVAAVEPEPEPIVAEAELGTVSGAGARAEEAGRRLNRRWYDCSLHALFSSFALLSSMSLSPLLLLGLLLAGAVSRAARTPRPLLHGCRARNSKVSKVSRTGIGPTRRWLILGWLAVVSGFRLPEDNGTVAQIDAGVNPLSPHESTITGEVDGAHGRRQMLYLGLIDTTRGSSCDSWYQYDSCDWCPDCAKWNSQYWSRADWTNVPRYIGTPSGCERSGYSSQCTRCVQCGADKYLSQACSSKITVSGAGGCQTSSLSGTYTKQGSTASGAPYYKKGNLYIYWDPNCAGGSAYFGIRDTARWIFDRNKPSTTAASALNGKGYCNFNAFFKTYSFDSSSPPRGLATWRVYCNPWMNQDLTIVENDEAGVCTPCSNIECHAGRHREGACTSRAAGYNSVAASALGRAPSCLALEASSSLPGAPRRAPSAWKPKVAPTMPLLSTIGGAPPTTLGNDGYDCKSCAHRVRLEHNSPSPTLAC